MAPKRKTLIKSLGNASVGTAGTSHAVDNNAAPAGNATSMRRLVAKKLAVEKLVMAKRLID